LQVLILSHYFAHGPAYDLEEYLRERNHSYVSIYIPLYHWQAKRNIVFRAYSKGALVETKTMHLPAIKGVSELLGIVIAFLKTRSIESDLCIGEDPLTAYLCILLKKQSRTTITIFHSHNYTALQINPAYRLLDRLSTVGTDYVWCLSKRLCRLRKAMGAREVIHTPVGMPKHVIDVLQKASRSKPTDKITGIYVGRLGVDKGVDILLKSLPYLSRLLDQIVVIGDGRLRGLVELASTIFKNVVFLGPRNMSESARYVGRATIGFMLSRPTLEVLTTDPLKPKFYLAGSTPIVAPSYVEISREAQEEGAGEVLGKLDPRELARAVRRLTEDIDSYVRAAARFAKKRRYWLSSIIFSNAFRLMGLRG